MERTHVSGLAAQTVAALTPAVRRPLRIVSLSCIYPTADEPQRGVFVRARLAALAQLTELRVIAPVGLIRWGANGLLGGAHPKRRVDHGMQVLYPRWFYAPNDSWLNGILLFLQLLPRFAALRRSFDWDLLDAHFGHPAGIAAALLAALCKRPFAVTLRGNELEHARTGLRRKLLGWALRRSSRVLAVSTELQELACALGVAPSRTAVSLNGVDTTLFRPGNRAESRSKLGLGQELDIVLSVASLIPRKRILDVLDAVVDLLPSWPQLRLVIAGGDGVGERAYAQEVRRRSELPTWQGKVILLGEITQEALVEWMNAADLLCLASEREGCPNAVLESLACGLPVVATPVGAIPDLLPSTDLGIVVETRNPAALAQALREALTRDWDRRVIADWGHARDWESVAAELLPLFEAAVEEERTNTRRNLWTSR